MSRRKTTEEFIKEAKLIHGDKFDYSLVNYKNKDTKIKIICKHHNIFEQMPSNHLKGKGCLKCRGYGKSNDDIIREFREVHADNYDYSKVKYTGSNNKVIIVCRIHGDFMQTPNKHIQKRGCPKCGIAKKGKTYSKNILNDKFENITQPEEYKLIPLGNNIFTIVDNEDFDKLKDINWSFNVGRYAGSKNKGLMHRFIMNPPNGMVIDHIDGNGLNNRRCNLRICYQVENTRNVRLRVGYTSKYKGVCWDKKYSKWKCYIGYNGRLINIDHFDCEIEAAKSYDEKAIELFGEFAHTNF